MLCFISNHSYQVLRIQELYSYIQTLFLSFLHNRHIIVVFREFKECQFVLTCSLVIILIALAAIISTFLVGAVSILIDYQLALPTPMTYKGINEVIT